MVQEKRETERARQDLDARVADLMRVERARYVNLLDSLKIDADASEQLREAVARDLRHGIVSPDAAREIYGFSPPKEAR